MSEMVSYAIILFEVLRVFADFIETKSNRV